jgi:hypothetical protein
MPTRGSTTALIAVAAIGANMIIAFFDHDQLHPPMLPVSLLTGFFLVCCASRGCFVVNRAVSGESRNIFAPGLDFDCAELACC